MRTSVTRRKDINTDEQVVEVRINQEELMRLQSPRISEPNLMFSTNEGREGIPITSEFGLMLARLIIADHYLRGTQA